MVVEYILKKHGIEPKTDLTIVQNIDFGLTAQALEAGNGDYTVDIALDAPARENEGNKVVSSHAVQAGLVPNTPYSPRKSYNENKPDMRARFVRGLQKGMDYVKTHTPEEIARTIQPQFEETELDTITTIVTRYYDQQTWKDNLVFEEESFTLLQDILEEAGELSSRVPYEDLVNTVFAEEAK